MNVLIGPRFGSHPSHAATVLENAHCLQKPRRQYIATCSTGPIKSLFLYHLFMGPGQSIRAARAVDPVSLLLLHWGVCQDVCAYMMGSSHVGSTLKLQGWLDNGDNVHLPSDNEDILEEDEAHVEAAERFEAQYNFRTEVRPTTSRVWQGCLPFHQLLLQMAKLILTAASLRMY